LIPGTHLDKGSWFRKLREIPIQPGNQGDAMKKPAIKFRLISILVQGARPIT